MPEITLLLVLLAGVVAGFFDSILGAGGLISVPSLVFLGLPPQVAIATDRLGTIGQTLAALLKFWKKIAWKYVPVLAVISLFGSVIGANILLNINPKMLQAAIGAFLLVLLPVIFLKQDIGVKHVKRGKSRALFGLAIYFFIMIFGGFFGQGTGPLVFYALTYFLGFTMIEVLATGTVPWLVLSVSSLMIFALNGLVDYRIGIVLLAGMTIGGYIGAHLALKKGNLWIKRLFVLFVIMLAAKLLLF